MAPEGSVHLAEALGDEIRPRSEFRISGKSRLGPKPLRGGRRYDQATVDRPSGVIAGSPTVSRCTLSIMRKRPMIISIEDEIDGEDARITVILDWADQPWHGQAIGSTSAQPRLAGEAALDAIRLLTGGQVEIELLAVATSDFGTARVALAQVRFGDDEVLVGSALQAEADGRMAAVRAVMDAINRRIELIL